MSEPNGDAELPPPAADYGALLDTSRAQPDERASPVAVSRRTVVLFMLRVNILERTHFTLFAFILLIASAIAITPISAYLLISQSLFQRWFVQHVNQMQATEVYLLLLFALAFMPGLATFLSLVVKVDSIFLIFIGLLSGSLDLAFNTCKNEALYLAFIKPSAEGFVAVSSEEAASLRAQYGQGPNSPTLIFIVFGTIYLLFLSILHLLHFIYYNDIRTALRNGRNIQNYVDNSGEVLV